MFGSEILAVVDADDRGYDLKRSCDSIFTKNRMRHKIFVDSRGVFDTITTFHEPRKNRLKRTMENIRDAFEAGYLTGVNWIDGKNNLVDCMAKWNVYVSRRINLMLTSGIWNEIISLGCLRN